MLKAQPSHDHIELAPFVKGRHFQQLCSWLKQPYVAEWWGDPTVVLKELDASSASRALILASSQPVGFLCWQRPAAEELADAGLSDLPSDLIDIDILIGEQRLLGRGIGPRALVLLMERLRAEGCGFAGLGTAINNRRALRAYKKVGLRQFREFEEEGQQMVYLVLSLSGARSP